jgi:hypothetical protein
MNIIKWLNIENNNEKWFKANEKIEMTQLRNNQNNQNNLKLIKIMK